jgi:tetratricopeptide (TPR) repeat protein
LWVALLLVVLAWGADAQLQVKRTYNVWAKEKIRYLNSKVTINPYKPYLRVLLANAYFEDGQKYEAKTQLKEALELDPNYAEAHCNLAVILHSQGYTHDAKHHYEESLRLDSLMVEAMAGLGALLCRSEHQAEGIEYLDKVVQVQPDHVGARFNMAVAYHKVGDFKKSIEHLETLLKTDFNYPGARKSLARAYYSLGLLRLQAEQPELALEVLVKAVEYEQQSEDMFFAKGLAHMESGDLVGAEATFKQVVALEQDHIPALHNLGTICEKTNRLDEAVGYYFKIQRLAPHLATIEAVKHSSYKVEYLVE